MKALRYLLMIVSMVSVLSIQAQVLAQQPDVKMKSTSGMVYSGSTLPQAAVSGAVMTGETPGAYVPVGTRPGHLRKVGEGEGFEDEGDPETPANPFPLGDAALPLMLLALAYIGMRALLKRKRA